MPSYNQNSYYPTPYQGGYQQYPSQGGQYYQNYGQVSPMQQAQQMNQMGHGQPQTVGIDWVQGEGGAKSRYVPPNTAAWFMDSECQKFYIKTTDASGMPLPLRKFRFVEEFDEMPQSGREEYSGAVQTGQTVNHDYLTKEEFNQRISQIENMLRNISLGGESNKGVTETNANTTV